MKKEKHCPSCNTTKKMSQFSMRTGYQKGIRMSYCKECMKARQSAWREKNRERFNLYQLEYRRSHPTKK